MALHPDSGYVQQCNKLEAIARCRGVTEELLSRLPNRNLQGEHDTDLRLAMTAAIETIRRASEDFDPRNIWAQPREVKKMVMQNWRYWET